MKTLVAGAVGFAAGVVLVNASLVKIWADGNWKNFVTDIDSRMSDNSGRPRQLSNSVNINVSPSSNQWMDVYRTGGQLR